jgi:hypothetical protein
MAVDGTLPFGSAELAGAGDGWITFVEDDPLYLEHVPESIREQQHRFLEKLKSEGL